MITMKTKTILTLAIVTAWTAGSFTALAQNDALTILQQRRAQELQQMGEQPAAESEQTPAPTESATESAQPMEAEQTSFDSLTNDLAMSETGTNGLRLNFRNAPLELVLKYLSEAAGFHIVLDTTVRGSVTVISSHPMTRQEAVDLVNSVLNKNGYAAIRNGDFLTIVDKNDMRGRETPVRVSNDPDNIPKNDEIVTQIIPIRFVEAGQLVRDLSSFVSSSATIVANEAGNSIVITDTQANIHHLTEIIRAIDSSAEGETQIKVFHLTYANPNDVATLLSGVFPSDSSGSQTPIRFGGGFGRGGGGGGGPFAAFFNRQNGGATGNNNGSQDRIKKQTQVIAVADPRTQSVVVTASRDLMEQITGMIEQLDVSSSKDQKVYVQKVVNGDPQQMLQVLQSMFPASTTTSGRGTTSSSQQNSALMQRQQNNVTSQGNSSSTSFSSGFGNSSGRSGGAGLQ